jgi:DNA polymerase-3 subunit gamma/tau
VSYVVIARKWRPQIFDEVIGQQHVSQTLRNAIAAKRVGHAFIFSGPRGVGKTTMARILAKALNCLNPQDNNPCNTCENCTQITAGSAMDVLEIDGASNRGIEEIRNLRESVRFTPTAGQYKVVIIDEVHMLTKEAFNALLKTLEEPPRHVIFIFATTEIFKVLPTILSRCQRFDFKSIPVADITAQLTKICKAENIEAEPQALLEIAKKADGGMRDAQSLLDQVISFSGRQVTLKSVSDTLGLIAREIFFATSDAIISQDFKAVYTISRKIYEAGYDQGEFLLGLEEHFRNILVSRITGAPDDLAVGDHFGQKYMQASGDHNEMELLRIIQLIQDAQNNLKRTANPQLKLELLLLKLATLPAVASVQSLLSGTTPELKKKKAVPPLATRPVTEVKAQPDSVNPSPAAIDDPSPLSLDVVVDVWPRVIEMADKNGKPMLVNNLRMGKPLALSDNGVLEIGFHPDNHFHAGQVRSNHQVISDYIAELTGHKLRLQTVNHQFKPEEAPGTASLKEQKLKAIIQAEPVIGELIDSLDCEVIDIVRKEKEKK